MGTLYWWFTIDKVEENASQNKMLEDPRWKEWADDDLVKAWLNVKPSLSGIDLKPYFWIARDSLKISIPIESLVSNAVRILCQNILHKNSVIATQQLIQAEMKKFDDNERQMLILLLNQKLVKNPNNPQVLQAIQADESHLIIQNEEDCNLLFNNINTLDLEPAWGLLLNRYKTSEAWKSFVATQPFDDKVKKLIK